MEALCATSVCKVATSGLRSHETEACSRTAAPAMNAVAPSASGARRSSRRPVPLRRACRLPAAAVEGAAQRRRGAAVAAVAAPPSPIVEEAEEEGVPADAFPMVVQEGLRNVAIIAHVDHGKTTLVDAMLKQCKVFRDNQAMQERIMDSNTLERERGITILAKNTALRYKGVKVNLIDTPGHADFGGEVERVLNMVDGVLLLVDAVEGPMPQTRFVLRKALERGHRVVVIVNKVDRPAARVDWVVNATFELFLELGATDEQCDFPIVYASGVQGRASIKSAEALEENLSSLFDAILESIPAPRVAVDAPVQLLVTNLDYDEHKGRIAIGRVHAGKINRAEEVKVCLPDGSCRNGKVTELFVFDNFAKVPVDQVMAGDICAVCGLPDAQIGETIAAKNGGVALPTIEVEEPTVRMAMMVNTSPFAGREGKFVTSRALRERLMRELERNLAMRVEDGATADTFIVSGRGTLHIAILIENMRREGYEFLVGPPRVILKMDDNGKKLEPYEEATVEVPEEYVGSVVDMLGQRKGQMLDMSSGIAGTSIVKYKIPTRGLLGIRNSLLTASRGTAVLNTLFAGYGEFQGDMSTREQGSLVSFDTGPTSSYALFSCQERGRLFLGPGVEVYKGMIVGMHQRPGDLALNACKKKAATNIRSNKDATVVLDSPLQYSLDDCIEYIQEDELVEITPLSVRMLKNPKMDKKARGQK